MWNVYTEDFIPLWHEQRQIMSYAASHDAHHLPSMSEV